MGCASLSPTISLFLPGTRVPLIPTFTPPPLGQLQYGLLFGPLDFSPTIKQRNSGLTHGASLSSHGTGSGAQKSLSVPYVPSHPNLFPFRPGPLRSFPAAAFRTNAVRLATYCNTTPTHPSCNWFPGPLQD